MIVVLDALRDAVPVDPWLAGLWLAAALALGAAIVYAWRRLLSPFNDRSL
jgi:hypothetical protein